MQFFEEGLVDPVFPEVLHASNDQLLSLSLKDIWLGFRFLCFSLYLRDLWTLFHCCLAVMRGKV